MRRPMSNKKVRREIQLHYPVNIGSIQRRTISLFVLILALSGACISSASLRETFSRRGHGPSNISTYNISSKQHLRVSRTRATLPKGGKEAFRPLSYYLRVALAGGIAGATGSFVLYPVDSAKTLRQSDPHMYRSVQDAFVKNLQSRNRFSRLYRGIVPAALGAIPSSALYFGAYESCKVTLERLLPPTGNKDGSPSTTFRRRLFVHGLAAASGNVLSSSVFVPKEVIKQQLQYHAQASARNAAKASTIVSIVTEKGISALYAGYGATLMRNIPSAMIRFVLYEELKQELSGCDDRYHALATFCAGAIAGSTASFLMTPADTLKTRMATGTCPLGVRNCMMHIVDSVGYRGLFAGAGSRVLWSGAFSAIGFGTFEMVKRYLGVAKDISETPPPISEQNVGKTIESRKRD